MGKIINFFKKAFNDMKQSAKEQHEVDVAKFNAVKAESQAQWEEAKMTPSQRREKIRREQQVEIEEANRRIEEANRRKEEAKNGYKPQEVVIEELPSNKE